MRIFVVVLLTLITTSAMADNFRLSCLSVDLKTSVIINSKEDKMFFTYQNIDGKEHFPLYSGIVTAGNFSLVKSAKRALSSIDKKLEFSWPLESCKVRDDLMYLIKCLPNTTVTIPNKTKLEVSSFSTFITQEQSFSFMYEKLSIRFILNSSDNKKFEITIPFSKERCVVELES